MSSYNPSYCYHCSLYLGEDFFMQQVPDKDILIKLVTMKMPFGKYKGTLLCNLPVSYLEWFKSKRFPEGKMGMLLSTIYEIKFNGLEQLLQSLKRY